MTFTSCNVAHRWVWLPATVLLPHATFAYEAHSDLAAKTVANEALNAADLVELNPSVASQQQLVQVRQIMAGPVGRVPFRDAQRFAQHYGGNVSDWVKKPSSSDTWVASLVHRDCGFRSHGTSVVSGLKSLKGSVLEISTLRLRLSWT